MLGGSATRGQPLGAQGPCRGRSCLSPGSAPGAGGCVGVTERGLCRRPAPCRGRSGEESLACAPGSRAGLSLLGSRSTPPVGHGRARDGNRGGLLVAASLLGASAPSFLCCCCCCLCRRPHGSGGQQGERGWGGRMGYHPAPSISSPWGRLCSGQQGDAAPGSLGGVQRAASPRFQPQVGPRVPLPPSLPAFLPPSLPASLPTPLPTSLPQPHRAPQHVSCGQAPSRWLWPPSARSPRRPALLLLLSGQGFVPRSSTTALPPAKGLRPVATAAAGRGGAPRAPPVPVLVLAAVPILQHPTAPRDIPQHPTAPHEYPAPPCHIPRHPMTLSSIPWHPTALRSISWHPPASRDIPAASHSIP